MYVNLWITDSQIIKKFKNHSKFVRQYLIFIILPYSVHSKLLMQACKIVNNYLGRLLIIYFVLLFEVVLSKFDRVFNMFKYFWCTNDWNSYSYLGLILQSFENEWKCENTLLPYIHTCIVNEHFTTVAKHKH